MRIDRLATLFVLKHKLAISPAELEANLRKKIGVLWTYPNKNFNILRACADSGASKPKNPNERIAVAGHLFCKELLSLIDYMKANWMNISLGEIREVLLNISKLIEKNKTATFGPTGHYDERAEPTGKQFPHVSELIFQLIPISKKHDIKLRDEQYSKARTGLARILSVVVDMMDDVRKLEVMVPEKFTHENVSEVDIDTKMPDRFTPQRSPLSEYDIIDFIRQHGDEYGIYSKEDWATAFKDDPQFKEQMTTVINALNRGHAPKDAADVKMQIAEIIKQHEERKSTNAHLFEDSE